MLDRADRRKEQPNMADAVADGSRADVAAPGRLTAFGVIVFAASVAALAALDAASPGQRWSMLDLQIYRWAGLLVRHSGDLYGLHFPHYHLRFTYSPMAALLFAAASAVPLPVLKWLITAGSIAALVATLWMAWGALGYRRQADRAGLALVTAGLLLWLGPVQQTLAFGQVNLVLMAIVVADLCLPDQRWFKGVGVGLAAGFKLTPAIFIPYLLLTRRFRAAGVATATFALTVAGSLIALPAQSRQYWLGGLFLNPHRIGNVAYVGNQSLRGALARLLGSDSTAQPYWFACVVLIGIGGLLLAAWTARRGHELIGVVTCALTGLLISPVSWSHHWVWVAPGLVAAADAATAASATLAARPARPTRPGWRRWAGWAGVAALAAPFVALPQGLVPASMIQGSGVRGAPLLTGGLYVIVGIAALCLVALWSARGRRAGPPPPIAAGPAAAQPSSTGTPTSEPYSVHEPS